MALISLHINRIHVVGFVAVKFQLRKKNQNAQLCMAEVNVVLLTKPTSNLVIIVSIALQFLFTLCMPWNFSGRRGARTWWCGTVYQAQVYVLHPWGPLCVARACDWYPLHIGSPSYSKQEDAVEVWWIRFHSRTKIHIKLVYMDFYSKFWSSHSKLSVHNFSSWL